MQGWNNGEGVKNDEKTFFGTNVIKEEQNTDYT